MEYVKSVISMLSNLFHVHVVSTWGEAREVIDYLDFNMYEGVRHLFGELYFTKTLGHPLLDVKVYA